MIPILLILGAGAALEIKRLTQRPLGGDSAQTLRERERELKEILQVRTSQHPVLKPYDYSMQDESKIKAIAVLMLYSVADNVRPPW
jgi:hypothetical protein